MSRDFRDAVSTLGMVQVPWLFNPPWVESSPLKGDWEPINTISRVPASKDSSGSITHKYPRNIGPIKGFPIGGPGWDRGTSLPIPWQSAKPHTWNSLPTSSPPLGSEPKMYLELSSALGGFSQLIDIHKRSYGGSPKMVIPPKHHKMDHV